MGVSKSCEKTRCPSCPACHPAGNPPHDSPALTPPDGPSSAGARAPHLLLLRRIVRASLRDRVTHTLLATIASAETRGDPQHGQAAEPLVSCNGSHNGGTKPPFWPVIHNRSWVVGAGFGGDQPGFGCREAPSRSPALLRSTGTEGWTHDGQQRHRTGPVVPAPVVPAPVVPAPVAPAPVVPAPAVPVV